MQDMNIELCRNARTNTSGRLIDSRDDKVYWVGKLRDGNCWMTQNLDLDLTTNGLRPADSDVTYDWSQDSINIKVPQATLTTINTSNWLNTTDDAVLSYDPGYNILKNGITSTAVSSELAYGKELSGFVAEDAHWLQGNYYSLGAASAGSVSTLQYLSQEVPDSVCPRGWKLPIGGSYEGDYSFRKLTSGITDPGTLLVIPYYYTYAGAIHNGSNSSLGQGGKYMSASLIDPFSLASEGPVDLTKLYYNPFEFDPFQNLSYTSTFSGSAGASVRCVVR